ncbi:hypothetical protein OEZ86_011237 [Tetradesmus obliquus]|nr:hypothetical protein OEZ86_011237 [Tetradesmus obliquus]
MATAAAQSTAQIRIGTRGSKLAKLQAQQVQGLLRRVRPEWTEGHFELLEYATHGDKDKTEQLRTLGQGAFTEVIDQAVADGSVDIGVHSLKDQPVKLPPGVQLAACLPRDDPRDAFISIKYACTADLPAGARVGTSSLRRKAQLLHAHPHLRVVPVRGNIDARLQMLESGELDAIVLAAAGLSRLGQSGLVTRVLGFDEMLPAACQGAIGISCRTQDPFLRWELGLICHEPTWLEIAAERAMLKHLLTPEESSETEEEQQSQSEQSSPGSSTDSPAQPGKLSIPLSSSSSSGSRAPPSSAPTLQGISSITGLPLLPSFAIACHAAFDPHDGLLCIDGLVASEDGRTMHRVALSGGAAAAEDAEDIGRHLGLQLREFALQHGWV